MALGTVHDFWQRTRALFPAQWAAATTSILQDVNVLSNLNVLANDSANLDALLLDGAYGMSLVYDELESVPPQIDIQTATGVNLDLIAQDYFGTLIQRRLGQSDASFRKELFASFFNVGPTLQDMLNTLGRLCPAGSYRILQQLPQQQAWNISNWGWDAPTAVWGSLDQTAQVLIQMPPQKDLSDQQVANAAIALTTPAGVGVWATTQVYGPPQPEGGVGVAVNIPGYAFTGPYIMQPTVELKSLLRRIWGPPVILTASDSLLSLLVHSASAPSILTPSAGLSAALTVLIGG